MEEFGSLWSYEESVDDLTQKLLYTSLELERMKMEANDAMKKHLEEVKSLLNLLKLAYQERDEARDQLQRLLNKLMPPSSHSTEQLNHNIRRHVQQQESPLIAPTKANSSITESNSLSETYNPQSHISSPVDSFFDAVSSPDFTTINMATDSSNMGGFGNQSFVQDIDGLVSPAAAATRIDPGTAAIDSIAKGSALPEQGKLLQAVMEAGPLLQTLLIAGPLPRWRNPPPLQPFKILPISLNQKPPAKSLNPPSNLQISRMSSHLCSTSMLNFSSFPAGSGQSNGMLLGSCAGFRTQLPSAKRQRFQ